jgi:hypothetical protein
MSVQENKEIAEPTSGDSLPEQNSPEPLPALETVTAALTLALDNIYVAKEGAQSTANEQIPDPASLLAETVVAANELAQEKVMEAVVAANEVLQQQVADAVVAANEVVQQQVLEQVMETVVAVNEVVQEKVVEQVTETMAAANEVVQEKVVEQVMETVIAANEVVQEKVAEEVSVMIKEIGVLAKDAENILDNIKGLNDGSATRSLAELLVAALNPEGPVKDLKIVISKDAHSVISTIAESRPAILDNIKKSLVEVTRDNKVSTNDIPQFISTVKTLYDFVCSLKEFKPDIQSKAEICATVFKIITHFLILDDQICADNADKTLLLTQLDDLIDSGVDLLAHVPTIKLKGCFFSFLCK